MEDSGVTSFSSSGSVDMSLDALDLSSSSRADDTSGISTSCSNDSPATPGGGSEEAATSSHSPGSVANTADSYPEEPGELQRQVLFILTALVSHVEARLGHVNAAAVLWPIN